jgi:DNA-binding response OmpR family regulator
MSPPVKLPEGTSILIVDDFQDNIDVLARRLRNRDVAVYEANDGHDALELLATTPVDIILLDVMMPGMSGLDVVRKIRARRAAAALPIIMVSARTDQAMIVDCLTAGANDYVTKPIDFNVVAARINVQLAVRDTYRLALRDRSRHMSDAEEARARLSEAEETISRIRQTKAG